MVTFFAEDIDFTLAHESIIEKWLRQIATNEEKSIIGLNYIFCSDAYLHNMNLEYLNHDTFTDIITFDMSESDDSIEGDVFVSIERVRENAKSFDSELEEELHRVLIHGLLHLIGYNDKTENEVLVMRKKEDASLSLLNI